MIEIVKDRNCEEADHLRRLVNVTDGRYIAVVTRWRTGPSLVQVLHDGGWSGVNVAADAGCHASLLAERPRDCNLHAAIVLPGSIDMDRPGDSAGANGGEGGSAATPTMTLAEVHGSAPADDIHLLNIDADAVEPAILDDAEFQAFRPWVVVVDRSARTDDRTKDAWRTRLSTAGYDEISGAGTALWFRARERGDLAVSPPCPADVRRGRDPADRTPSASGGSLGDVEGDHAAALLALARAREDVDGLQARYAREAKLHGNLIERLRGELRDAQSRAASLETLQADSLRLARIAALLDGKLSAAIQNYGLETFRRGLVGQVGAWMAEVERDRTDLLFRLEVETHRRHAVLGSTSWRLTGPLRRLGRASRVALHQPRRVPLLLIRKLRRVAPLGGSEALGAPTASPASQGQPGGLVEAAARIDGELVEISELLQRLSAVAAGRDDGHPASLPPPGSEAYRAMTPAGRLAAWIRYDAARQRANAP